MRLRHVVSAVALLLISAAPASAALLITIDKSAQRMSVEMDGQEVFNWPVSTGTRGYDTPSGEFKPFRMEAEHFSREWDDAPMPHSIFFTMKGHAIHGTSHLKAIGTPASHGCVRLAPENAAVLFKLVRQEKMANTRVVLLGETPAPPPAPPVASRQPRQNDTTSRDMASRDMAPRDLPQDDFTGALPPQNRRDVYRDDSYGGDLGRPNRGYAQQYRPYRGEVFYDRYGRAYVYERRGNSYYERPYGGAQPRYRETPWGWN